MANTAQQLTGQNTPTGRIPFLRYVPSFIGKKQPCIIYLHGQGNRSTTHNTTSVLTLQGSGEGLPWLTNIANSSTGGVLPGFDDINGEAFQFYVLAPQLYGEPGFNNTLWTDNYITAMIDYAVTQLNVDPTRIYLCGYSLGMGGTIVGIMNPAVNSRIAAASGSSPGYGNGILDHKAIAESGIPLWWQHANDDTTALVSTSTLILRKIMDNKPLRPPKLDILVSGNHQIQFNIFNTGHPTYPMTNGQDSVRNPNMFEWFLRHRKIDNIPPLYIQNRK